MPDPQPGYRLRRLVALRQGRLPVPEDLDGWLTQALGRIVKGADPEAALEIRVPRGAWSKTPERAAAYARRDAALAVAFSLASGSDERRGNRVIAWWDEFHAGKPLVAPITAAMREVARSGIPMPTDARTIERRTREARSRVVPVPVDCETVHPEARQFAATDKRP